MKKIFTLLAAVMCFAMAASADDYRRTWDFREGWSASTLEMLAGDTDNWQVPTDNETGFNNKVTMNKDVITVKYNGEDVVIPELEGLRFKSGTSAKRIQVWTGEQKNTSFPDSPCLWINGKTVKIELTVPAGENVKFGYCSHSNTENRGFTVGGGFADAAGNTKFTSKADATIVEVELINSNTVEANMTITSTNGAHIYYIIIGEGDVAEPAKIGYLYYEAAGTAFEALPLYTAVQDMPMATFVPVKVDDTTITKDLMMSYDAVILDGSLPVDADLVASLKENIQWTPVVNFNPAIAQALGYGEIVDAESEFAYTMDQEWFAGYEAYTMDSVYTVTNGSVFPGALKLTGHAGDDVMVAYYSLDEEVPSKDSVVAYAHNAHHNSYIYYGVAGDYAEGTDTILKNIIAAATASKSEISVTPAPAFKGEYKEMQSTVTISSLNKSAVIYYTTDGTEPTTESAVYTEPLVFTTEGNVIKAIAVAEGYTISEVNTFEVKLFHQAKAPVISVEGNSDKGDVIVTLSAEEGADIWYNFTASADSFKSSKYVGPIILKRKAEITAFAISNALALVQSELTTDSIFVNMQNVFRDELAHFSTKDVKWNNVTETEPNLVLNDQPMTAWVNSSNYYFSWGKTAAQSFETVGDPKVDENGELITDENGNPVYDTTEKPAEVTTNTLDPDWKLVSQGQVMIYQGNNLGGYIGDFTGYNPERAEDLIEDLGTSGCVQFGGVVSGDKCTASIQSTKTFPAPFNLVAIVANVNGDKTTGVASPKQVAFQVSKDGQTWETVGEVLNTASIYRNYKKFEVSYEGTDEVYVRLASISGTSQAVHDIYVFNKGEKSKAEETGVAEVEAVETAAPAAAVKYVENGKLVIKTANAVYNVAGAQIK